MKILVTGATGFIGWHLCKSLAARGHSVVGTHLESTNVSSAFENIRLKELSQTGIELIDCDLTDPAAFVQLKKHEDMSAVVHLAGRPGVRFSRESVPDYADSNLFALSRVLDFVRDEGVPKFIFASSSTVYESLAASNEFSESEVLRTPGKFYGLTKLIGESMVEAILGRTDTQYTIARFFSVYGPLGRSDMAYQRAINCAIDGEPFQLNGDGSQQRDFTYIDDALHVLNQIISSGNESGPLNIGGGNPRSILELLQIVERVTGSEIKVLSSNVTASNEMELPKTNAAPTLLESRGFQKPETSLEEGISKTIEINDLLRAKYARNL